MAMVALGQGEQELEGSHWAGVQREQRDKLYTPITEVSKEEKVTTVKLEF